MWSSAGAGPSSSSPKQWKSDGRVKGCLVQVGKGIELEALGLQFEPYRWRPCGVTWDSSRTVVVIKLRRTSAKNKILQLCHREIATDEIQEK